MSFLVFAWIASIFYGLMGIITKLTGKYSISNPWLLNFLFIAFQLIVTLPLAIPQQNSFPLRWTYIILSALCYAFFGIFYVISISKLDVSTYIPLFNFRAVFAVLLGIIFLGEKFYPFQLLLIGLIFIAGIFSSIDEKFKLSSFFKPQIAIAVTSVAILAINGLFINKAISENSYWQVSLWQYIFALLFLLPTIPKFSNDIKKLNVKSASAVFLIALCMLVADLAANKAYAQNLGISSVIISLPVSMLIAFLFSIFAPKLLEKHTLKVYAIRFSAAAIMIISALNL